MASLSSSPSAPAFSSQSWKYDIFLSFRGEDTRNTFVGHLYSALEQEGIYTYKDDETLPRGETIRPSLMKAIEESQIAVIVFSKNYGDSSWCLDELAHIMKCRDTRSQIVMPIFYDVDPSEVRKQKRKYGEAFAKHELENKAKVESWRKALVDASNISGWEPKHIADGHEAKGIKQIVFDISQKLQPVTSSLNENLIGMAARLQGLESELEIGSGGVRMIGIWGVGGGGKTTLASSIYNQIYSKFDGCCFVENIREESGRNGLGKLKEKILSEMEVNRAGGRRSLINDMFRHRKVLIVLDDVDHLDQLKALAGSHDWFGEGSRIIITTRDKHLLAAHKVNVIHNINLLNNDEAIKLFCKHAPLDNRPVEDYEWLSKEVVSYAGGLPLALTVLGSFLCDKDINEWRSALARLKEIPDTDIVEKLKISFDGLKPVEKELFLDIACFFRGVKNGAAMMMLDACGFHPVIGVKVLIQKALITISKYGEFDMHDLVQEMAHYIVRGEHPKNPEKHSRVWKTEDVLKICAMDGAMELDMIEAIKIRYARFRENDLPPVVANMKNLRYIEWEGVPANLLLNNFPPKELCCLILYHGLQKRLWEGCKYLPNLRMMELYDLKYLIRTPDFDGLPNLARFKLIGSSHLEKIHPSIGHSERLVFLSIEKCSSLKMFPPITRLKKLKTLSFSGCFELFKLSVIQQNIHLDTSGKECCLEDPCLLHNLQELSLTKLDLSYCNLGDEDIGSVDWKLSNLQELNLKGNKFSLLSFSRLRLPRLKWLNVPYCNCFIGLSELPSSIAVVKADSCKSLKSFGDISHCKWLWKLSLRRVSLSGGDILLDSMLQRNSIEDRFIGVNHKHQITMRLPHVRVDPIRVMRPYCGGTFTLCLPHDWYNYFCGFLIRVVTNDISLNINIIIKQQPDAYSGFELLRESNEAPDLEYDGTPTSMHWTSFSAELIPRKSDDHVQTTKVVTDCSAFLDDEDYRPTFSIQHDSRSSVRILWRA